MTESEKTVRTARARAVAAERPVGLMGALSGLGLAALICARMMLGG
ncbi:MAG: hypothetical protein RIG84_12955 [Roseovarius sp.]